MTNRPLPPEQRRDIQEFRRLIVQLRRMERKDYEQAGEPLGSTERGFELWRTFRQKTTTN